MKHFFNRLTILEKILFTSLIFALPIFVLLFYMVAGFNADIRFARTELSGTRLLVPLQALAQLVPEHHLLVRLYIEGDKAQEDKIHKLQKEIDGLFAELRKESANLERTLQITDRQLSQAGFERTHLSYVLVNWQEIEAGWKNLAPTVNDDLHGMVVKPINALIRRIADTSNMVLDADLDTYYLVDTLVAIERSQERLADFILYTESVIFKGMRSQEDIIKFGAFSGVLETDLQFIKENLQGALRENRRLYGQESRIQKSIPARLEEYEAAAISFIVMLKRFANDPKFTITTPALLENASELTGAVGRLRSTSMAELQTLLKNKVERHGRKRLIALVLSLSTLFIACCTVLLVSRGITRSLNRVIDLAGEIAAGNLRRASEGLTSMGIAHPAADNPDSAATPRNEIYRLFGAIASMTSGLASLLNQVSRSGVQVTSSSTEIAASARELEATVAQQAASVNEVSATSKEISATSEEFADTMRKVAEMAAQAAELSGSSMASLGDINATMKKLMEGTTESSAKLQMVSGKMDNITQVITTITKVANQINLLSLNAAIEAEKAGEQGIGFSVVAREIRRLADQTAVATLDIESMIVETQDAMKDGVAAVDAYTDETRASTEKIAEISVDLLKAIEHTQELVPQFEAVNEGMQMQSRSAAQISEAMWQLSQAAKQTRDSLVEFRKVTEQLNAAAKDLQGEVARFSVDS
jgi:methyl-accepting chemotaxis protein